MQVASELTNHDMAYYIDMSLIGILLAVTLLYLPRTFARYAHQSGWTEGWALLRGTSAGRYPHARPAHNSEGLIRDKDTLASTATHLYPPERTTKEQPTTSLSSATHIGGGPTIKARLGASSKNAGVPPAHVPSFSSILLAIGKSLEYRIWLLNYSVRHVLILSVYLVVVCVGVFYRSNPSTNTNRAGFIVLSQMPFAFALGTKNSVITVLTGIGYEKVCVLGTKIGALRRLIWRVCCFQLNYVHRWVGRVMFFASLFHAVGKRRC
jgi:ferric-chelate reductase